MTTSFIPLDQFLADSVRKSGGTFRSETPRLGIAGNPRIGKQVPMYFVGRTLSDQEFSDYAQATSALGRQSAIQQLIEITRLNHSEYKKVLNRFSALFEEDHAIDWATARDMIVEVNRHVLNFLSAMKTFLDHTQTRLDRQFGKESSEFKQFKAVEYAAFDHHFSYRFVSKLRNYTQHCGMPLGNISANVVQDDPPVGTVMHIIDFYFDRDSLLTNFSEWSRHVEPELKAMPPQFPISEHIDRTMECLEKINAVVMANCETAIRESLGVVEALLGEFEEPEGTPCVFTMLSADTLSTSGKTIANMSLQRFHMQHVEGAKHILTEIAKHKQVESEEKST